MKLRNKKTGEIKKSVHISTFDGHDERYYGSIAELNEEWEDYEPKEPLIKDKNTRKAVRTWAEVNSIEKVIYAERPNRSLCNLMDMGVDDYSIEFVGWIPTLQDGDVCTIEELCGRKNE